MGPSLQRATGARVMLSVEAWAAENKISSQHGVGSRCNHEDVRPVPKLGTRAGLADWPRRTDILFQLKRVLLEFLLWLSRLRT